MTALSKSAMLASAAGVNRHLEATSKDTWCCVLPSFHVGGLGIYARASLTRSKVIAFDWDPVRFARQPFTLSSLVPAQLGDLVSAALRPLPSVRAVILGGGAVPDVIYDAARALGWPVLPSYGMTECCSQIATATGESRVLRLLGHMRARVAAGGRLAFAGPSLLTGYATADGLADPKRDGWFVSEDVGDVEGDTLRVRGRSADFVKIGGESVDLQRLDAVLDSIRGDVDAAVIAVEDERLGSVIHLALAGDDAEKIVETFNERVLPFERIRAVHRVQEVPRSPLGKLLRQRLAAEIQ